jgi:ABC-type Fe3+-siderophore transport system permease subunit
MAEALGHGRLFVLMRVVIHARRAALMPASKAVPAVSTGAIILLVSDTFARTMVSPIELPVGIIMYIIGGIFFLFLILRGKDSHIY